MELPPRSQIFLAKGLPVDQGHAAAETFRFCTYNILADGPHYALSAKFDYCPLEFRLWKHRLPRLLAELDQYDADIYAIQELQQSPFPTFQRDFLPAMEVS